MKPRSGEDWPRYIRIQVPSPATLKSLGREVLTATGLTEVSMRLTAWELWRLVRHRLALLGIVVPWFDEAHDMFLSGSAREIDDMLKMLKSLMQNDSAIIPILSGTERLSEITSYDPQVNRRFTKVVPSPLVAGKDNSDLLGLIESFCDVAELKLSRERDLTDRLIFASRQRFGRAVETILDAIECAKEEGSSVLLQMHFAEAWGMREGCDWNKNVFVTEDWASLDLDAGAEEFEARRSERQARQVSKR
nr:TniB family NTP-binding protein [Ruegeria sp. HKCCA0370]